MKGEKNMLESRTLFGAIRRNTDEGRQFVEVSSIYPEPNGARMQAEESNRKAPTWGQANPIIRIGKFILQEVE